MEDVSETGADVEDRDRPVRREVRAQQLGYRAAAVKEKQVVMRKRRGVGGIGAVPSSGPVVDGVVGIQLVIGRYGRCLAESTARTLENDGVTEQSAPGRRFTPVGPDGAVVHGTAGEARLVDPSRHQSFPGGEFRRQAVIR